MEVSRNLILNPKPKLDNPQRKYISGTSNMNNDNNDNNDNIPRATSVTLPSAVTTGLTPAGLYRSTSLGSGRQSGTANIVLSSHENWQAMMTVEERIACRGKIREAYQTMTNNYEELLNLVTAIDEELVFVGAASRFEYIKCSLEYQERLSVKKKQMDGSIGLAAVKSSAEINKNIDNDNEEYEETSNEPKTNKRQRK